MNNADVTVYDLQKWLSPLWKGNTVYAETAFILKNALGEIRPKRLAYPVKKIVSVRSFDLQTVYEEGKDYSVNEYGELQVLPEGKIPYLSWNEYRFSEFVQDDVHIPSADALGAQCVRELFADKDGMSAYTLAVTYEHEPDDYYAVTAGKSGKFPRTLEKLKNGQNIKIAPTAERNFFRSALFLQITDGNRGGAFRGGKISRLYLKAIDIRTEKSYNDKRVLPARRENGRER